MATLKSITVQQFHDWPPPLRVLTHEGAARFASLRLADVDSEFALSWRSERIEPTLVACPKTSAVWIGVDQRVACLATNGAPLLALALSSIVLDIRLFPDFALVICDAELVGINPDYSIREMRHLSDIPSSVELVDGSLRVTFIDGSTETLRH